MNKYDVIVIGAGLGGLSCAARLSALGYRTAVFESHTLVPAVSQLNSKERVILLTYPSMASADSKKAASLSC